MVKIGQKLVHVVLEWPLKIVSSYSLFLILSNLLSHLTQYSIVANRKVEFLDITGPPQEVRQPRKLVCLDISKTNVAVAQCQQDGGALVLWLSSVLPDQNLPWRPCITSP